MGARIFLIFAKTPFSWSLNATQERGREGIATSKCRPEAKAKENAHPTPNKTSANWNSLHEGLYELAAFNLFGRS